MKRLLTTIALLLPLSASADDFARTTAAEQLVDLMNQLSPFDASLQQNSVGIVAPLVSNLPCPVTALPDVQQALNGIVNYQQMRPYLVKAYADTFSFNDLAVIRAFYLSESGKKLLQLTPQIEVSLQNQAMKLIEAKMPELKKTLDAHAKDVSCKVPDPAEKKI